MAGLNWESLIVRGNAVAVNQLNGGVRMDSKQATRSTPDSMSHPRHLSHRPSGLGFQPDARLFLNQDSTALRAGRSGSLAGVPVRLLGFSKPAVCQGSYQCLPRFKRPGKRGEPNAAWSMPPVGMHLASTRDKAAR